MCMRSACPERPAVRMVQLLTAAKRCLQASSAAIVVPFAHLMSTCLGPRSRVCRCKTHSTPPSQSWGTHEPQNVQQSDDSQTHSAPPSQSWGTFCFPAMTDDDTGLQQADPLPDGVDMVEYQKWQAQIARFHKAARRPFCSKALESCSSAGHAGYDSKVRWQWRRAQQAYHRHEAGDASTHQRNRRPSLYGFIELDGGPHLAHP